LHCYSITNTPSFEPLGTEFIKRMQDVGIEVEAFHSEYGAGQYEFTCHHADPMKAADDAIRAKTYLKQLAAEQGLVATFMPAVRVTTADARSGGHINLSLWKDGKNAFWDAETESMSELGRQAAAGIMATMSDFHLVYRPYVNSYRRMDRMSWNPEDASWGVDNHGTALRIVHGSEPAKLTRLEHRAPCSDLNPYLSIATMLWGALQGIKQQLVAPEYALGDPFDEGDRYTRLPHSLADSVEAFRTSALTRELLGDEFVDHFAVLKSEEWQDYSAWVKDNDVDETETTDWELRHYFEWI
jgi:glutamine synthetase